ncbi:MAG: 16S rRNA (guanine(527)-N(7))-methyltransferase RsmG [Alphaproteobacteria bacterium CG1_02_46_17]|nr:MAG: 16S rRNA (guanine(527)-N(7))-methyltransferase RsmG [Alphaproteobacteria bacterium CG1_02_46_17]
MTLMPHNLSKSLAIYKSLLLKWSKAINLVAPSTLQDIEKRHFEDSLQLLPYIPSEAKIVFDFGSGAGFPALVLAMARPDLSFHLFESDQKKCSFLSTVSRETFIPVVIHNERVEHVDIKTLSRPDVITARALASLDELLTLSRPWWDLEMGGNKDLVLVFPKGEKAAEETEAARKKYEFSLDVVPSKTDRRASVLVISKVRANRPQA